MKRWFDSFEVTIEPGGIHQLRMSGRIVRILDIENGEEVHAKVDGSAWARMEEGTTSPDTVEVFNTLQLWNRSDAEITVKGRILYGEDKDDRKKLIGAVKIDDSTPVRVENSYTLVASYKGIDSDTILPANPNRKKVTVMVSPGPGVVVLDIRREEGASDNYVAFSPRLYPGDYFNEDVRGEIRVLVRDGAKCNVAEFE